MAVALGMGRARHVAAGAVDFAMLAGEVRLADVALWHAVVREQDAVVVLMVGRQFGRFRQGMDVLFGAVERGQELCLHPRMGRVHHLFHLLHDRLRGGHRELGVQGNDQGMLHAVVGQLRQAFFDAHGSVAHAQDDRHVETGLEEVTNLFRVDDERRAVLCPNLRVSLGRLFGSGVEDDATHQQCSEHFGQIDHPGIHEEFVQVRAYVFLGGAVGRAQIDEKNALFHVLQLTPARKRRGEKTNRPSLFKVLWGPERNV